VSGFIREPGIGKSKELEKLKAFTVTKTSDSSQVLELNLRSCTNLKEDLFKVKSFVNWLGSCYHIYLCLDSLDERLLSIPTPATGFIDELKKPKYMNFIVRLHLRIACRTFVFPATLEEGLKALWEETNLAIYELSPLRRIDVIKASPATRKDVTPLNRKPGGLMEQSNASLQRGDQG